VLPTRIAGTLTKVRDFLFRTSALKQARAQALGPDDGRARCLAQARLIAEVARRTVTPVEALPGGSRAAVLIALYRDAAYWALAAGLPPGTPAPPDLPTMWGAYTPEQLPHAVRDPANLAVLTRIFIDQKAPAAGLQATEEDAARARAFVDAVLWDLDAWQRRIDRLQAQRWLRVTVSAVALIAVVIGLRALTTGANLAEGKPFRTSTTWSGWAACQADGSCSDVAFHTDEQMNPWVEYDLGAPKKVKRIEVKNREECCRERAVPLVAEVSNDRINWTEVARRDTEFSTWTAKFPARTARYVRLRVPRTTTLHLREVVVR
jgi:hypothetical protein